METSKKATISKSNDSIRKWEPISSIIFYIIFIIYSCTIVYMFPNWTGLIILFCGVISTIVFIKTLEQGEKSGNTYIEKIGRITVTIMFLIFWGIYASAPLLISVNIIDSLGTWSWIILILTPILEFIFLLPIVIFVTIKNIKSKQQILKS